MNVLASLKTDFKRSGYIEKIKSPDIRKVFTRLRVDINILNGCQFRFHPNVSKRCIHCRNVTEGVKHFLLDCDYFKRKRDTFYRIISNRYSNFVHLSADSKLKFILNLECPAELEGACCKFVYDMYTSRVNM